MAWRLRYNTLSLAIRQTGNFASWFAVGYWFVNHVCSVSSIKGRSMSPTLNPAYYETGSRDYVLINKDLLLDRLERGMIVTFQNPTKDPRSLAVKRIIALEGDTVKTKQPAIFDKVVIPKGHIWVEGDFEESQDCNTYGPISANLVYGHVTRVLWPPERAGRLSWEDWKDQGRVHQRSNTDQWDEEWL